MNKYRFKFVSWEYGYRRRIQTTVNADDMRQAYIIAKQKLSTRYKAEYLTLIGVDLL